jgi:hypothetical protein
LAAFDKSDAESFGKAMWLRVMQFPERASVQLLEQITISGSSRRPLF